MCQFCRSLPADMAERDVRRQHVEPLGRRGRDQRRIVGPHRGHQAGGVIIRRVEPFLGGARMDSSSWFASAIVQTAAAAAGGGGAGAGRRDGRGAVCGPAAGLTAGRGWAAAPGGFGAGAAVWASANPAGAVSAVNISRPLNARSSPENPVFRDA